MLYETKNNLFSVEKSVFLRHLEILLFRKMLNMKAL